MGYPRKVSKEVKAQMMELHQKGYGHGAIARLLNLHKTTVRRHVKDLVLVEGVEFERADYVRMKIKKLEKQLIEIEKNNIDNLKSKQNIRSEYHRGRSNGTEHLTLQELLVHYNGEKKKHHEGAERERKSAQERRDAWSPERKAEENRKRMVRYHAKNNMVASR